VRIASTPAANSPAYEAGLDTDDEIRQIDGQRIVAPEDVEAAISRRRPGDTLSVIYADRSGTSRRATVKLAENPQLELVPVESTGGLLAPEQKLFRERWLGGN
jgi:predicted metalloprotease with PDZ domain